MGKIRKKSVRCGQDIFMPLDYYYPNKNYYCDKCRKIINGDLKDVKFKKNTKEGLKNDS